MQKKNSPFILCLQLQVLYAELPISYKDLLVCGLWFAQVVLEPIPTDPGGQLFSVCMALHWYQLLFNAMWRASYPKITYSSPPICCAFLFYIIISSDVNILIYSFTRLIFLAFNCVYLNVSLCGYEHISAGAPWIQKKVFAALKLELQMVWTTKHRSWELNVDALGEQWALL